jgi:predicted Zn finger-like uncharacterized protein
MPITTTCPGCKALFRLPEELAGKQVRCQKCAQMFEVPLPIVATVVPAAVAADSPAEAPILATVVEPTPPREEPILATVVDEAPPQEEPILAKVVEPSETKAESVPAKQKAPPPDRSLSVAMILAMVFLFVAAMLGTGTFAVIWVTGHLSPPTPVMVVPPLNAGMNVGFDGNPNGLNNGGNGFGNNNRAPEPERIEFGFNVQLLVNGRTHLPPGVDHGQWNLNGPYYLYRVHLLENTRYNFSLHTPNNQGRLRIVNFGLDWNASAVFPANRVMTSVKVERSGDYVICVSAGFNPTDFGLTIAKASNPEVIPLDLKGKAPVVTVRNELRPSDPFDFTRPTFGPYRDYEINLEANVDYSIRVRNAAGFTPALVMNGQEVLPRGFLPEIDYTYRAAIAGKVRIRVTSQYCGLGNYEFSVSRVERPEAIISAVGKQENRALTAKDAFDPIGNGHYKLHHVALDADKVYVIDLKSDDFTTRLSLYGPDNKILRIGSAKGGKNAQITFRPTAAGTYKIRAASVNNGIGPYTLTIESRP